MVGPAEEEGEERKENPSSAAAHFLLEKQQVSFNIIISLIPLSALLQSRGNQVAAPRVTSIGKENQLNPKFEHAQISLKSNSPAISELKLSPFAKPNVFIHIVWSKCKRCSRAGMVL